MSQTSVVGYTAHSTSSRGSQTLLIWSSDKIEYSCSLRCTHIPYAHDLKIGEAPELMWMVDMHWRYRLIIDVFIHSANFHELSTKSLQSIVLNTMEPITVNKTLPLPWSKSQAIGVKCVSGKLETNGDRKSLRKITTTLLQGGPWPEYSLSINISL